MHRAEKTTHRINSSYQHNAQRENGELASYDRILFSINTLVMLLQITFLW